MTAAVIGVLVLSEPRVTANDCASKLSVVRHA